MCQNSLIKTNQLCHNSVLTKTKIALNYSPKILLKENRTVTYKDWRGIYKLEVYFIFQALAKIFNFYWANERIHQAYEANYIKKIANKSVQCTQNSWFVYENTSAYQNLSIWEI